MDIDLNLGGVQPPNNPAIGGTVVSEWTAGTVTGLSAGLSIVDDILTVTFPTAPDEWNAGTVDALGNGMALNGTTLSVHNTHTQTGTVAATSTIAPGNGTDYVILDMPITVGTVTLAASPTYQGQSAILDIVYGATLSTPALGAGFVLGGGVTYTPGTLANTKDRLGIFSPDQTHWVIEAVSTGGTI